VLIASSTGCPNGDLAACTGALKNDLNGAAVVDWPSGCPKRDPPDGCWLVAGVDPNIPPPFVAPNVLPPFVFPNMPVLGVADDTGVPKRLLPGVFEEPNIPVDGACEAAGEKGVAAGCWFPPNENIPVDGAAAGCDPPKLNPKPPLDAPLVVELDIFAKGLFTGADAEKSKPELPLPLPNPPKDTFGDPLPIEAAPFVGGKLWAPFVKRPCCGVEDDGPKLVVGRAGAPPGLLPFAALIL
jgi:hypothetical protein